MTDRPKMTVEEYFDAAEAAGIEDPGLHIWKRDGSYKGASNARNGGSLGGMSGFKTDDPEVLIHHLWEHRTGSGPFEHPHAIRYVRQFSNPRFALWRRLHPDAPTFEFALWNAEQVRIAWRHPGAGVASIADDNHPRILDHDAYDAWLIARHHVDVALKS